MNCEVLKPNVIRSTAVDHEAGQRDRVSVTYGVPDLDLVTRHDEQSPACSSPGTRAADTREAHLAEARLSVGWPRALSSSRATVSPRRITVDDAAMASAEVLAHVRRGTIACSGHRGSPLGIRIDDVSTATTGRVVPCIRWPNRRLHERPPR